MRREDPRWENVTLVGPSGTIHGRMWRDNDSDSPIIDVDGWRRWQHVWETQSGYTVTVDDS